MTQQSFSRYLPEKWKIIVTQKYVCDNMPTLLIITKQNINSSRSFNRLMDIDIKKNKLQYKHDGTAYAIAYALHWVKKVSLKRLCKVYSTFLCSKDKTVVTRDRISSYNIAKKLKNWKKQHVGQSEILINIT